MTGIVFWSDNAEDLNTLGDKAQLEFSYLIYADVVRDERVYACSVVDDLLSSAAARGRQVIFRFRHTYPGITRRSVPRYLSNSEGYTNRNINAEDMATYVPDWSSTALQDFTLELFTQFAARYDDPRLALVQIGFGSYSEYHLYDGPLQLGDTFPTKEYQTTFLNQFRISFRGHCLCNGRWHDDCQYYQYRNRTHLL